MLSALRERKWGSYFLYIYSLAALFYIVSYMHSYIIKIYWTEICTVYPESVLHFIIHISLCMDMSTIFLKHLVLKANHNG